jgi:hypothetical protein
MRFHCGEIPAKKVEVIPDSWKLIRGPKTMNQMQWISLPVGIVVACVIDFLWLRIKPDSPVELHPVWLAAALLGMPVIHEFVHALAFPQFGMTREIVMGVHPGWLLYFYVYYDGPVSRNRMLAVLLMPFLLLTILPLVVCSILGVFSLPVLFFSVANAMGARVDISFFCILAFQVPSKAMIHNNGKDGYWSVDSK